MYTLREESFSITWKDDVELDCLYNYIQQKINLKMILKGLLY